LHDTGPFRASSTTDGVVIKNLFVSGTSGSWISRASHRSFGHLTSSTEKSSQVNLALRDPELNSS